MRKLWMASLCLVAAIATANAQSNYAVVRGSVFDPQHRAIPGAHIHANEVSTGAEREVVSNASGLYEIAGLQPGAYTLTVDSQGFAETKQSINLEVGQQATLDIELRVTQDVSDGQGSRFWRTCSKRRMPALAKLSISIQSIPSP